ncbi:unnamed protein product [Brassica rapa]|uniref:Transmembrane protein n=1 Tax=Brassica campestris TaxID=3711 RepID=A0A3P6BWA8_BRACM|nr:unnamed protein product [Brassica rapa]VDD00582.1 unnamed protein product [Brassica rapa]
MAMTSTSSSTSLLYPSQQQPQQPLGSNEIEPTATNANLRAKKPNRTEKPTLPTPIIYGPNHYSTGSIGPFFAVISVLVVLAVLSCFLGWICAHRRQRTALVAEANPLEMISSGGLLWWVRPKWKRCLDRDVEAAAKVADCFWQRNAKRW